MNCQTHEHVRKGVNVVVRIPEKPSPAVYQEKINMIYDILTNNAESQDKEIPNKRLRMPPV